MSSQSLATLAIHADDSIASTSDVAPPIHVSTTFRYPGGHGNRLGEASPDELITAKEMAHKKPDFFVYSRHSSPTTARLEKILSVVLSPAPTDPKTPHTLNPVVTYSSGQSAFHAALVHFNPRAISYGTCYHGCKAMSQLFSSLTGMKLLPLDCPAEDLQPGDIIHLETPINPTGTTLSIEHYAQKAHSRGAFLIVDSTFAPPPLQNPFQHGADIVMHSSTKYIGGHSDMLGGVLAVRHDYANIPGNGEKIAHKLITERLLLGGVMGSLEGWLGLRSIRTLSLRVTQASQSATKLVQYLATSLPPNLAPLIKQVHHASLEVTQDSHKDWLPAQMPNGYGPVFAITMRSEKLARWLPSKLHLFHHATSLGGVESLIEWRALSDEHADTKLLRISVGIEGWEDLRDDIVRALEELLETGY
ncbi:pyridoxal phosphate-dependent transferase [Peziza echinospora]|nr:pyridoxal phosphate-dependent transferase [Peziza echinospora]